MTLRLTVQAQRWEAHVATVAAAVPALVPVVKGNGYGFGRDRLATVAAPLALAAGTGWIAVGTVHEAAALAPLPSGVVAQVLTPQRAGLPQALPPDAVLCVGSVADCDALAGARWRGAVHVKLASTMRRYGAASGDLDGVVARCHLHGLEVRGYTLHLPLAGTDGDRSAEAAGWLDRLAPGAALSVSHLAPAAFADLAARHPRHRLELRLGTALWHGDKSMLHLGADVVAVHDAPAGERAGYRATPLPGDGRIVLVGAGSAHGIAPLADGRSPLHFARARIDLLEPPHMHTTMAFVPAGAPCPAPGEWVDVQRPLTVVAPDEVVVA